MSKTTSFFSTATVIALWSLSVNHAAADVIIMGATVSAVADAAVQNSYGQVVATGPFDQQSSNVLPAPNLWGVTRNGVEASSLAQFGELESSYSADAGYEIFGNEIIGTLSVTGDGNGRADTGLGFSKADVDIFFAVTAPTQASLFGSASLEASLYGDIALDAGPVTLYPGLYQLESELTLSSPTLGTLGGFEFDVGGNPLIIGAQVPEPAMEWLLAVGLIGAIAMRPRRVFS